MERPRKLFKVSSIILDVKKCKKRVHGNDKKNLPRDFKAFVSVIAFRLNLIIRISFAFLVSKGTESLQRSLFLFWMVHGTHYFRDGCLSSKVLFEFLREILDTIGKTWFFYNISLFYNKQKKTRHEHFSKNCFDCEKTSIESHQHQVLVLRSRGTGGLSVVT